LEPVPPSEIIVAPRRRTVKSRSCQVGGLPPAPDGRVPGYL